MTMPVEGVMLSRSPERSEGAAKHLVLPLTEAGLFQQPQNCRFY
jgi:hypothetical protein